MSNFRYCVTFPPGYHLSPAFGQHINTLLCIVPLKSLPHTVSNTGFSFVASSGRPPCVLICSQKFPQVFCGAVRFILQNRNLHPNSDVQHVGHSMRETFEGGGDKKKGVDVLAEVGGKVIIWRKCDAVSEI